MSLSDDTNIASGRHEGQDAVIPEDPPPFMLRSTGWLLIIIFVTILLASVWITVPETVQCRYMLVPEDGADPIQSPLLAVVDQVDVKQGQRVEQGDRLFVLRSDEIRGWQTELRMLEEDRAAKTQSLELLESSYESELRIRDAEIERYEFELEFREEEKTKREGILAGFEALEDEGIVSTLEMTEHELRMEEVRKDIDLLKKSLFQVQLARERIVNERSRRLEEESAELDKIQVRIEALETQLEDSDDDARLTVRAPYDSVVIDLKERSAGNVVQPAEELCQLARLDGEQHARLLLGERALALVAIDQRVRLFFDAFPYQRYGTITGRLRWISEAAVSTAAGNQFVATASLDRTSFRIADRSHPLQAGMTGNARVVVGSRTLAENLIEPLRRLREETRH